jgi:hypothetical protein
MPRYFIELQDGRSRLRDCEGQEFRDLDEAGINARQVARELARNHPPARLIGRVLVLLDAEGRELQTIPLTDVNEGAASPPRTRQLVH